MNRTLILLLALAPAGAAHARTIGLKPPGEARLRHETVEQDGIAVDTDKYWLQLDWIF